MRLPTSIEINPHPGCLDGDHAVRMFLGKDLVQAEAMFEEDGLGRQEDLFYMGPKAFMFYFEAALNYLKSSQSQADSDFVSAMTGLLEWRLLEEYEDYNEISGIKEEMKEFASTVIENYDKYDVTLDIYGNLRPRLELIIQKLL